ncbi:MAG: hypothetical protein KGI68_15030, partial [Alphaproteobacteria bacterium]|nr:hypothetical protein [Alphaproteobacteria bacterium]
MARYVFKLPDVGEGMAEAEIVAWHVAVGDKIQEDQNLVDVMTDKATVEITSPVTGIVVSLGHQPGEMAAIGAPLVEFELDGAAQIAITSQKSEPAPSEAIAVPADKNPIVAGAKTLASPAVRKRAQ